MTATATTALTAVTSAVMTQAAVTKAATANSARWHHIAIMGAVWSPTWAWGEGINQRLAGGVCQNWYWMPILILNANIDIELIHIFACFVSFV